MKIRELSLSPIAIREPVATEVYSPYYRAVVDSGLEFTVTVHGAENPQHVVINTEAWSGYVDRPDESARNNVIANAISKGAPAAVVSIDNPGVGSHGTRLSSKQRKVLRSGNLTSFTEMQYTALEAVSEQAGIHLAGAAMMGYSLGALMAANLAPLVKPSSVALMEPVGASQVSPWPKLASSFLLDGMRMPEYKRENPDWYRSLPQTKAPQVGVLMYDYVKMMARGGYYSPLEALPGTPITVVRASQSRITDDIATAQLAKQLPWAEQWVLRGENHSMLDSIGRFASLAAELHRAGRL